MGHSSTIKTSPGQSRVFANKVKVAGLLLAWAPEGSCHVDRCQIKSPFIVGRSSKTELPIRDDKVSGRHLRIFQNAEGYWIEDLKSTNGTFVDGSPVHQTSDRRIH